MKKRLSRLTKKTFLAVALTMLFAGTAAAQLSTDILGDRHAMVRIEKQKKYILLPVEEKEHNAHVRVVKDNELVKTFNLRLAVNQPDYYVPYEIGEGELLDIVFAEKARSGKSITDYNCWSTMRYTDTVETANKERLRPLYHHSPAYGWMNDPNGMVYKDGTWHLCYQWNPYGSYWENMTWGHATSNDLVHWTQQPAAIYGDALGAVFSGSAVVDKDNTAGFGKGALVALYTSARERQTQSLAYSTDNGKTWKKYANNPILTADIPDFRDPKVIWNEERNEWILVLAAGQEMRFYTSKNLKEWKFESAFGKEYGNHGGVWECPDLMKMKVEGTDKEKWMLICNINPGGPFGGSATQYFVGEFDGHKFTCEDEPKETKWMDYGKDHYATVTFSNTPDGRNLAIAWMSNWQYANDVPTMQFRSANSLPRELGLYEYKGETYCSVVPAREMLSLRGKASKRPTEACEILVTLKGNAQLTLKNSEGEKVVMTYDAAKETFTMDRSASGNISFSKDFACATTAATNGKMKQLRIFIDRCSIEAFDANGRMSMTNLVFPSSPYNTLEIKGKAKAKTYLINH